MSCKFIFYFIGIFKINSNESLKESGESESDEPEQNVKIKLKSTTLLIQNQKVLKQDLSRINKIFHTKFN